MVCMNVWEFSGNSCLITQAGKARMFIMLLIVSHLHMAFTYSFSSFYSPPIVDMGLKRNILALESPLAEQDLSNNWKQVNNTSREMPKLIDPDGDDENKVKSCRFDRNLFHTIYNICEYMLN